MATIGTYCHEVAFRATIRKLEVRIISGVDSSYGDQVFVVTTGLVPRTEFGPKTLSEVTLSTESGESPQQSPVWPQIQCSPHCSKGSLYHCHLSCQEKKLANYHATHPSEKTPRVRHPVVFLT